MNFKQENQDAFVSRLRDKFFNSQNEARLEVEILLEKKFRIVANIAVNSGDGISIFIQDRKKAQYFMDFLTTIPYTIQALNIEGRLQEYCFMMYKDELLEKIKEWKN